MLREADVLCTLLAGSQALPMPITCVIANSMNFVCGSGLAGWLCFTDMIRIMNNTKLLLTKSLYFDTDGSHTM